MNIFYLDHDPKFAARYAVDDHTNKLSQEACQILSTVHWLWRFKRRGWHPARVFSLRASREDRAYRPITPWGLKREIPESRRHDIETSVHGCIAWAAADLHNYAWLSRLSFALHSEWVFRRRHPKGHRHACYNKLVWLRDNDPLGIPNVGRTPVYQAMPDEYRGDDPVQAYRRLYRHGKAHLHKWTRRGPPPWL